MNLLRHLRVRTMLDAYVDDELGSHDAALVSGHLRSCWWCSGDVQTLRLIKAALLRHRSSGVSLPSTGLQRFGWAFPWRRTRTSSAGSPPR